MIVCSDKASALNIACSRGHRDIAQLLLQKGANVEVFSSTALHKATGDGSEAIVRFLLGNGANVNARKEKQNDTALHIAKDDDGETVLHVAKDAATAEILLEMGPNVNATDVWGSTALHYAAKTGREEITRLLLARGADFNAKNRRRDTVGFGADTQVDV